MSENKRGPGRPRKHQEVEIGTDVVVEDSVDKVFTDAVTSKDPEIESLKAQIELLTKALVTNRNVDYTDEEDMTVGVMRIGGPSLSAFLTDAYGREKHFFWKSPGQVLYMTPAQYEEMMDKPGGRAFFERGFLKLESEAATELAIVDPDEFIENLNLDDIDPYFADIKDPAVLLRLVNHIDHKRIITEDPDTGKPFVDSEGNPRAEIKNLGPKYRMVQEVCVSRLYELTGVRYSLLDG